MEKYSEFINFTVKFIVNHKIFFVPKMLYERRLYSEIKPYLLDKETIVIHGARQVGKTSLLKYIIQENHEIKDNHVFIDLEDIEYLQLCNKGVNSFIEYLTQKNLLKGKRLFVFIDEIQYLDNPSNFLKLLYDHYWEKIKLIVTGSSTFSIKSKFKNSLVGRTVNFELFPLSFQEFLAFKNINIRIDEKIKSTIIINELKSYFSEFVKWGGYPAIVLETDYNKKKKKLSQIISTYIKADIRDLGNIKNLTKFNNLLTIIASQVGNLLNLSELSNTIGLAKETIENYLFILENTYVIKLVRPFSRNLRTELTKMPKIYFEDTGIRNLLLNTGNEITGSVFENAVFSELRKKIDINYINYWRTIKKHEIDFILNLPGRLIPLEVKVSYQKRRYTSLVYFKNKYNIRKIYFCRLNDVNGNPYKWLKLIYPWDIYTEEFNEI